MESEDRVCGLLMGEPIPQPNPFTKAYSAREIDAFLAGKWRPGRAS